MNRCSEPLTRANIAVAALMLVVGFAFATGAQAHEIRPVLLDLHPYFPGLKLIFPEST